LPSEPEQRVPGTAAFSKFMKVLQAVSDADGDVSVSQLATAVGLPRPTVHRIVAALLSEGMLADVGGTGRIALGPRLIDLAGRSWAQSDLRRTAEPLLAGLRDELDETVHLALASGDEMVYIDKFESRRAVRMASRIGARVPMHSSSVGKAWLASLDAEDSARVIARLELSAQTPCTVTDRDALTSQVDAVRASGYAVDLEENERDICCYGIAIAGRPGAGAVGCISVSFPTFRFDRADEPAVIATMQACAAAISAAHSAPPG
jgi:DNA-binding IclR family transcriptional regulator